MEIKSNLGEIANKFGKEHDAVGSERRGKFNDPTVIYISGIPNFDAALYPNKFEETNCLIEVLSYENCILFI